MFSIVLFPTLYTSLHGVQNHHPFISSYASCSSSHLLCSFCVCFSLGLHCVSEQVCFTFF